MSRTAFVTGGTGFIGINLIELLIEEGWEVTALHRPTSDLTYIEQFPVNLREGSVTDRDAIIEAVPRGTEVIFHLAGDTNHWSGYDDRQTEVHVNGTHYVVEAAVDNGVDTLIHTSSISAWGQVDGEVTEETPQNGHDSWVNYEYTKWLSEREALKAMDEGVKVVILNPGMVIGPYDKNNWGKLFFALEEGNLPGIPGGEVTVNHVREVARAHLAAVDRGGNGERYILAGDNGTFEEFIGEMARYTGTDDLPRKIPDYLLKLIGHVSEWIAKFTGNPPDITPELARMLTRRRIKFNSEKAIRELDYTIVPMEQSVRDCYEWLVREGYIDGKDGP